MHASVKGMHASVKCIHARVKCMHARVKYMHARVKCMHACKSELYANEKANENVQKKSVFIQSEYSVSCLVYMMLYHYRTFLFN